MAKIVSEKLQIPLPTVLLVYKSYWDNIKDNIEDSRLRDHCDGDEIDFPLSYNIGSIGKMYTSVERIKIINNRLNSSSINENT